MIQPLAYVHPTAKIADNVVIDPFVTIHADVEIGEGTHVMSGAVIFKGSRIGKHCRIFPGASIGAIPQDLKFEGEETQTIIGDNTTIREFVKMSFAELGIELGFKGTDDAEEGYVLKNTGIYNLKEGQVVIKVDPKYYRPTEVDLLIGDPTKAMTKLGWKPKYNLAALVKEMVASDLEIFKKELLLKENGYTISKEAE